jgi:hypothetical protein
MPLKTISLWSLANSSIDSLLWVLPHYIAWSCQEITLVFFYFRISRLRQNNKQVNGKHGWATRTVNNLGIQCRVWRPERWCIAGEDIGSHREGDADGVADQRTAGLAVPDGQKKACRCRGKRAADRSRDKFFLDGLLLPTWEASWTGGKRVRRRAAAGSRRRRGAAATPWSASSSCRNFGWMGIGPIKSPTSLTALATRAIFRKWPVDEVGMKMCIPKSSHMRFGNS